MTASADQTVGSYRIPYPACDEYLKDLNGLFANTCPDNPTGISALDAAIGGGLGDELMVVGGIPGIGKTDFAVNLALAFAKQRPVLFASCELGTRQIITRALVRMSTATAMPITERTIRETTANKMATTSGTLAAAVEQLNQVSANLIIIDNAIKDGDGYEEITVEHLHSLMHRCRQANGVAPAVIIDYLQQLGSETSTGSGTETLDHIAKCLALMAHTEYAPVVALSSLTKDGTFRGSSHIEHAADCCVHLVLENKTASALDEMCQPTRSLLAKFTKNRNGMAGINVRLSYTPEYHLFG